MADIGNMRKKMHQLAEELALTVVMAPRHGMSGGNCWGDDASPYRTDEQFSKFDAFDDYLERYYPDISFLKYRRLRASVVSSTEHIEREYYGNYSVKERQILDLVKLCEEINAGI